MKPRIDLAGKRFGKLFVLPQYERVVSPSGQSDYKWLYKCDCGQEKYIRGSNLRAGLTNSCGCNERAPGLSRAYKGYPTWVSQVWQEYKAGAKLRGYTLELTIDQVASLCSGNCYYCGAEPRSRDGIRVYGGLIANGIDRKDNSLGYTSDNCVSCCTTCNTMKMALHHDEFLDHIRRVYEHHS